jgi:hypothetical protein
MVRIERRDSSNASQTGFAHFAEHEFRWGSGHYVVYWQPTISNPVVSLRNQHARALTTRHRAATQTPFATQLDARHAHVPLHRTEVMSVELRVVVVGVEVVACGPKPSEDGQAPRMLPG